MIQLVAIDLDGTLFGENLVISPANREAIAAVLARGVRVTIATGRMYRATLPHARVLGITTPLICYQGALIRDPTTDTTLFHRPLPQAVALDVIALLSGQGLHPNIYLDDNLYTAETNPGTGFYSSLNGGLPVTTVGDLATFLRERNEDPTKLSVVLESEAQTEATVALLRTEFRDRLYATKSYPIFAEAINATCDKGVALETLAAHLGIAREAVMAVGDGANDLPMLRWAGLGVAMGQAREAVRREAHHVTATMVEDGVAAALHRFILDPGAAEAAPRPA